MSGNYRMILMIGKLSNDFVLYYNNIYLDEEPNEGQRSPSCRLR